jgi:phospholipid N-methyltransferase
VSVTGRKSNEGYALLFMRNFLKHPKRVGAIIPSSPFLIRTLLSDVDWLAARIVVEYGPGVGTITQDILARMHPDCRLVVIEMNDDFVAHLRLKFSDPRLTVVHGSAANAPKILAQLGHAHADYIISSIPFSTMPEPTRTTVIKGAHQLLHPDGTLIWFQYRGVVADYLRPVFKTVERDFELRNIPPALIYHCSR